MYHYLISIIITAFKTFFGTYNTGVMSRLSRENATDFFSRTFFGERFHICLWITLEAPLKLWWSRRGIQNWPGKSKIWAEYKHCGSVVFNTLVLNDESDRNEIVLYSPKGLEGQTFSTEKLPWLALQKLDIELLRWTVKHGEWDDRAKVQNIRGCQIT